MKCSRCGKEFTPTVNWSKYCSTKCRYQSSGTVYHSKAKKYFKENWKDMVVTGKWKNNSTGYIAITLSSGNGNRRIRIDEHRWVMMQHIGRTLETWEHIHHKNGNKHDNRLENLEMVSSDTHAAITVLEKENRILRAKIKELEETIKVQEIIGV